MAFLTAEWRDLAMLNWGVPPDLLAGYVPQGTELDTWNGRTLLTLVGFRFLKTRMLKMRVPFHTTFEEVNLRFYVKRSASGEIRRGVVFIKEIVPRACIALVARRLYNENYIAAPMSHRIETRDDRTCVRYDWTIHGSDHSIQLRGAGPYREMSPNSQEEFVAEHYWGYCRQRDSSTIEYRVNHPRWQVAAVHDFSLICDSVPLYGKELGERMLSPPTSVYLANGSQVEVGFPQRL